MKKAIAPRELPLAELQMRLVYAVIVAGKSARFADNAMAKLQELPFTHNSYSDRFQLIGVLAKTDTLAGFLRKARTGNYRKVERFLREVAVSGLDLRTCSIQELERIHGIGPKTSRFFVLWTRPEERLAALDVHVLRWLRARGHDAPQVTPSGAEYDRLQKIFIAEADARGMTPRELDWAIWQAGSGYEDAVQTGPQQEATP